MSLYVTHALARCGKEGKGVFWCYRNPTVKKGIPVPHGCIDICELPRLMKNALVLGFDRKHLGNHMMLWDSCSQSLQPHKYPFSFMKTVLHIQKPKYFFLHLILP